MKNSFWYEVLKFCLIALFIVLPFRLYVAQPYIVSGASMDPTFETGEYLIVDQLSYRFEEPKRGSVVIFKYPVNPTQFFIKRVIGLPGETVEIHDGVVTIKNFDNPDGFTLDEKYISSGNIKEDNSTITLSSKEFFVMGDNRKGSSDSRSWGPVKESLIMGRPVVRLLPLGRAEFLPGDNTTK